jgi:hypothetical protein
VLRICQDMGEPQVPSQVMLISTIAVLDCSSMTTPCWSIVCMGSVSGLKAWEGGGRTSFEEVYACTTTVVIIVKACACVHGIRLGRQGLGSGSICKGL